MAKSSISICALMLDPHDTMPGQRFRIEQWQPYLRRNDISLEYFSFTDENLRSVIYEQGYFFTKVKELTKAYLRRVNHVITASRYDAVYLYRTASMFGPAVLERFLRFRNLPIIYDFDDAIFLTNTSKANKLFGWAKFAGKTRTICNLSTSVTVGNNYLADFARQYNERVYVIPSSIDTVRYQPMIKSYEPNKRVIIGWTGSSTSQYHLEAFEPTLVKLLGQRDVEIRVISNRKPTFKQIPFVWREWASQTEVEETSQFDVGIMPLPDDDWARGKCAMKALIYMSLGIPAVCSNVGVNSEVINHAKNGFLANSEEEWLSSLKNLIDNTKLRTELGLRARETVVNNYSMTRCAEIFTEVVHNTINLKRQNLSN